MTIKQLPYFANGEFKPSQTTQCMDCYDPSIGQVIAQAPQCTVAEVEEAREGRVLNSWDGMISMPNQ